MQKVVHASILLLALLCSLFSPSTAPASDQWTMYQGNASHTGYIPVTLEPSKFALRWEKKLGSEQLNPVTAAGGRVFISINGSDSERLLYALNSKSGRIIWSKGFDSVFIVNPPSYHDGKVYVQTTQGVFPDLRAYDAETGDVVFENRSHETWWDGYFSPTIYKETIYIHSQSYGDVRSFDGKSGTHEWTKNLLQRGLWTPAVDEKWVYAYTGGDSPALCVADRLNGKTIFSIPWPMSYGNGQRINPAPVLGGLSDVFGIVDGRLVRFDLDTRQTVWANPASYSGQPTVANGVVFAINSGALSAHDQRTGAVSWTWGAPDGKSLQDTIIATDSHLFVRTDSTTYCIALADQKEVWSYPAGGHLSLGESTLYIAGSEGALTAISLGLRDLHVMESVLFDPARKGQTVTKTIRISNVGDTSLRVRSIESSPSVFSVQKPTLPLILAAHESVSIPVAYTVGGRKKGKLTITSNDPNEPVMTVDMTGRSKETHTVTATCSSGGSIGPLGKISVRDGDSIFFSMIPEESFNVSAVLVDGVSVGNPACYRMDEITGDHTISTEFAPKPFYTVSASASAGGWISPNGDSRVMEGVTVSVTTRANTGSEIADVFVDGVPQETPYRYYFGHSFTDIMANHSIKAVFKAKPEFFIDASTGEGGSISPSGHTTVYQEDSQSFIITPATGFKVSDIIVDGVSQGITSNKAYTYDFSRIVANHSIAAVFSPRTPYVLDASAGEGGLITPSGKMTVYQGDNVTCSITANTDFMVSDVIVDGVSAGASSYYYFSDIKDNHSISVTFVPRPKYVITASANEGGKITPLGQTTIQHGGTLWFEITPYRYYKVSDVLVDGVSVGAQRSYYFRNVTDNHTIAAVFNEIPRYVIDASAGPGGKIDPSGQITMHAGDYFYCTIVPEAGFRIREVLVDGVSVGNRTSYSFNNIGSDHSISALFDVNSDYFGVQDKNSQNILMTNVQGQSAVGSMLIARQMETSTLSSYRITQTGGTIIVQKAPDWLGMTQAVSSGTTVSLSAPLVMQKKPLVAGQSWTSQAVAYAGGGSARAILDASVSARTLMQVPAGFFLAFPITYTLTMTNGASTTSNTWTEYFAPYIGTVKSVESDITTVVTKFKTNGGTVSIPPPVVTIVNPSSASPGTQIKIKGYQFGAEQAAGKVTIGGVEVSTIISWSDRKIVCVVPEGATSGKVVVDTLLWTSNGVRIEIE